MKLNEKTVLVGKRVFLVPYLCALSSRCRRFQNRKLTGSRRASIALSTSRSDFFFLCRTMGFTPEAVREDQTYHEWMKSPDLLELTASEPLSLEEEHAMQSGLSPIPSVPL